MSHPRGKRSIDIVLSGEYLNGDQEETESTWGGYEGDDDSETKNDTYREKRVHFRIPLVRPVFPIPLNDVGIMDLKSAAHPLTRVT